MHKSLFQIALEFRRCYHNNRDIAEHAKIECIRSKDRHTGNMKYNTKFYFSRSTFLNSRILRELLFKLFFYRYCLREHKASKTFISSFSKMLLYLSL